MSIRTLMRTLAVALGLVLLPILLYHPWQLLVAGLLRNAFLSRRDLRADTRSSGPTRP